MSAIMSNKSAGGNLLVTASVANAAAAGTIIAADLQWNTRISAAKEIIIPTSEEWILTDVYVTSTANAGTDVNPVIEFRKDNDRLLDTSHYLLSVVVTNTSRPNGLHGNLSYEGGSHMSATIVTSAAAGAARSIQAITPYEKNA